MLSTGNNTKSILVPARPPAVDAIKNVLKVNVEATTYGLFSTINNFQY